VQVSPRDEWPTIREIFVQSFLRYPLYKHMVPEDSTREQFLRAYLDANHEVTVGTGKGVLLGIKIPADDSNTANEDEHCDIASNEKIVGGVLFVPPAKSGSGWAIGSDEPYWQAYEKHGLARISPEGLERAMRWEFFGLIMRKIFNWRPRTYLLHHEIVPARKSLQCHGKRRPRTILCFFTNIWIGLLLTFANSLSDRELSFSAVEVRSCQLYFSNCACRFVRTWHQT